MTALWYEDLAQTLDQVWAELERGVADRDAPARHLVLATLGTEGWPEARILVLRGADRLATRLEMHTDAASAKVAEIMATPRASLHFWNAAVDFQIRLRVTMEIADEAYRRAAWAKVPDASRANYGITPAPGTPICDPSDPTRTPDFDRFLVLQAQIAEIDTVCLAGSPHTRAEFRASDGFAGSWLSP